MGPEHLRYTENHEWIRDDGGMYVVGITEYAAEQLGDITYVELPEIGEEFEKDDEVATVESIKAASEVYAPVGGAIAEVNESLPDHPEIINNSPYEAGWIFKLNEVRVAEFEDLMGAKEYDAFVKAL